MLEFATPYLFDFALNMCDIFEDVADNFPTVPVELVEKVDVYFDLIFSSTGLVPFFIDVNYVKLLFPFLIAVLLADKGLKMANWVSKFVPFINR